MKIVCFISSIDVIQHIPIIKENEALELIKIHYPNAPIVGNLFLSAIDNYKVTCNARPDKFGFDYVFTKVE